MDKSTNARSLRSSKVSPNFRFIIAHGFLTLNRIWCIYRVHPLATLKDYLNLISAQNSSHYELAPRRQRAFTVLLVRVQLEEEEGRGWNSNIAGSKHFRRKAFDRSTIWRTLNDSCVSCYGPTATILQDPIIVQELWIRMVKKLTLSNWHRKVQGVVM